LRIMPAVSAYAPGKIILFGEHAVVYGRPAVAVPVHEIQARAMVQAEPRSPSGKIRIQAPDIGLDSAFDDLPDNHPLRAAAVRTLEALHIQRSPAFTLRVSSTIPIASGLGSGAAVTVAVIRALSSFLGHPLPDEAVCSLAYEVEKLHHGTPSGIDNTVVTYGKPVYFRKGLPPEIFKIRQPFTLVIGDTGIVSPTAASVGEVRKAWQKNQPRYESLFDSAGAIADSARQSIETGAVETLGPLMDVNHGILKKMGVSSPELDALIAAARKAGAWGAKLSGGGRGGNMIALVSQAKVKAVSQALLDAGAVRVLSTVIGGSRSGKAER
jgi:mevalonate kinase